MNPGMNFGRPLPNMNFPKFDGTHLRHWILECQGYFKLKSRILDDQKISLASMNFEGKAAQWYRNLSLVPIGFTWEQFVDILSARFEELKIAKIFSQLNKLRHIGEYTEYVDKFEELKARIMQMNNGEHSEELFIGIFVSGLGKELQSFIRMLCPTTLAETIELGRIQSKVLEVEARKKKPSSKCSTYSFVIPKSPKSATAIPKNLPQANCSNTFSKLLTTKVMATRSEHELDMGEWQEILGAILGKKGITIKRPLGGLETHQLIGFKRVMQRHHLPCSPKGSFIEGPGLSWHDDWKKFGDLVELDYGKKKHILTDEEQYRVISPHLLRLYPSLVVEIYGVKVKEKPHKSNPRIEELLPEFWIRLEEHKGLLPELLQKGEMLIFKIRGVKVLKPTNHPKLGVILLEFQHFLKESEGLAYREVQDQGINMKIGLIPLGHMLLQKMHPTFCGDCLGVQSIYSRFEMSFNWNNDEEDATYWVQPTEVKTLILLRKDMMHNHEGNLQHARTKTGDYADGKGIGIQFTIGKNGLLKMQPFQQKENMSCSRRKLKLITKYFRPHTTNEKIGELAYHLELPAGPKIQLVSSIFLLNNTLRAEAAPPSILLETDRDGAFLVILLVVLEVRSTSRQGQVVSKLLKKWGSNTATTMPNEAAILVHKLSKIDPWGQGSLEGGSIVMTQRDSYGLEK